MNKQETYVELAYENLLAFIYGRSGRVVTAGWTTLPLLKKSITKVFRTLSRAAERNINGDEAHKENIRRRCDVAIQAVNRSKSKDEVSQIALAFSVELNFHLLGRMPKNWKKGKADWRASIDLAEFRTLCYVRTAKQRIDEIIDYAYNLPEEHDGTSLFQRIIDFRNKHPHDDPAVLSWIKKNEPESYAKFNHA